MENLITFKINETTNIKFILPCPKEELFSCDEIIIMINHNNDNYQVYSNDCILWALRCFDDSLNKAINFELQLDSSIDNLGYLLNQNLHDPINTTNDINGHLKIEDYEVWDYSEYVVLLYNKGESIFLEVAPVYKWHNRKPTKDEQYIPYDEFIKNYQSILTIKIDKETAQQLLNEAEALLEMVQENERKNESVQH